MICFMMRTVQEWVSDPQVRGFIDDGAHALGQIVFAKTSQMLYAIPQFLIFVAVSFFISFYLFIDGRRLLERVRNSLPIRRDCQKVIFTRIAALTRAVIFGSIPGVDYPGNLWLDRVHFAWRVRTDHVGRFDGGLCYDPVCWHGADLIPAAIGLIAKGSLIKGIILFAYGGW